jgi:hypothetical protein
MLILVLGCFMLCFALWCIFAQPCQKKGAWFHHVVGGEEEGDTGEGGGGEGESKTMAGGIEEKHLEAGWKQPSGGEVAGSEDGSMIRIPVMESMRV